MLTGKQLGEYELLHALKSGGMGDVLLARRRGLGGFEQLVAIKTVRADLAAAPLARAMFLDEARLLARLTHPGIAQILDFGEADGVAFMVMEYVPGMSFRGLADLRPPPAILCQAVADACRGLHAAHELRDLVDGHLLGVVHRDISPDNLMVGYDARVKVLDFGIALVRGRQAPVTELGVLKGKPPYMSPEQVKNQPLDRRSDVFSTSVVLWELVTGQPLFEGDSIYAVARAVEHQEIVPPSRLVGRLPDELDDVILAGLARDPDRRLASAAAMAEVLERIAGAAGHVSFESWAERALAPAREAHRRWLADVLGGRRDVKPAGRATGMQTAVDAEVTAPSSAPPREPTAPVGAAGPVRDPRADEVTQRETPSGGRRDPRLGLDETIAAVVPAPRRRRWLALVAILVVLGGGGALWQLTRGARPAAVAVAIDAGVDAAAIDAGADVDAAVADAAEVLAVDARAAIADAGEPGRRRDAGPGAARPIDAGAEVDAARSIDAAVATGFGTLVIAKGETTATVTLDDAYFDQTPVTGRRVPAGRHRVVLTDPSNGKVLLDRWIEVVPGQTVRLP